MFGIGGTELVIILLFAFLIVGPDKLPEVAKTLGKGVAKFRSAQDQMNDVIKEQSAAIKSEVTASRQEAKKAAAPAKEEQPAKAADPEKAAEPEQPRTLSFSERKAQYEKERAQRQAEEAERKAAEDKEGE